MAIPTVRLFQDMPLNRLSWFNYPGSQVVNLPDMMVRDPITGTSIYSAAYVNTTNYPLLTTSYLLIRFGAKYFAGFSGQAHLVGDTTADPAQVTTTDVIADMVCASSTFSAGQLVGFATNAGVTALLPDTVVAVNDPALAIGVVVKEYPSATTLVRCRIIAHGYGPSPFASRIGSLKESFSYSALTGGATTTGTYTFLGKIPAGAVILGWTAYTDVLMAGAGPLTAMTCEVGVSGTLAAWSTITSGSVFLAGASIGSGPILASGTALTELSPLATFALTGGNVNAMTGGHMSIKIDYLIPTGL